MNDTRRAMRVIDEPSGVVRAFVAESASEVGVGDEQAIDALDRIREDARREGYRDGRSLGEEQLREETERFRHEMTGSLRRLTELEQTLTRQHEQLLMEVALEAASRIVRERIEKGDPVVARAVKEAMEVLRTGSDLRARIHPGELQRLTELLSAEIDLGRIKLVADESITPGGSVVESSFGTVDVTIEAAEEALRAASVGAEELS